MATYGRGQMLGSGINPESFKQDYSGFSRAAEIQAQGLSNLGASIGGAIKDFGEAKEQRKKIDAETKASRAGIESAIKLGDALGFDVKGMLSPVLERMDDPNTTPMEAAALGREASTQIANVLNLGFKAKELESQRANLTQDAAYKKAQLEIAQQNANSRAKSAIAAGDAPPATIDMPLGDGSTQKMQWNGKIQSYVPIKVSGLDGENQAVKGDDLIGLVKGFEGFNPRAYNDYKQISIGYGTKGKEGEVLNEEQATERLKSELSGHAERIAKAAELKGIALNQNQFNALTSFDYNTGRGANLIERFGDNPQQLASKILEYTKAGGEDLPGLVKRRQIEAALFLAPEQRAAEAPQPTSQNQGGIGFTPAKVEVEPTARIITGEEAQKLGGDPNKRYTIEQKGNVVTKIAEIPPDITPAEQRERQEIENEKAKTQRAGEIVVKSINKFIDKEGNYNESLDRAVGYGEELATGVAKAIPFLGTQSPKDRANQKDLAILVEKGILEAASLLKPVSNVDLLLLKENRPKITDPPELWAGWLKDVRDILGNPNSYAESGNNSDTEKPQSATDRLRALPPVQ